MVPLGSPAAIVIVKAYGNLTALGDGPQGVDIQMQHAILYDVAHLRETERDGESRERDISLLRSVTAGEGWLVGVQCRAL